jgi:hypothetical protein
MYGLVPYNLSPIQQGIQFGHAVVEYSNEFFNDPDYQQWSRKDKTFIILNGGTTNLNKVGTLNAHEMVLYNQNVKHHCFHEPDLGDQLTAVVFLVDDRVWDKEKWPDYEGNWVSDFSGTYPEKEAYAKWATNFDEDPEKVASILWMRDWLKNFRLA